MMTGKDEAISPGEQRMRSVVETGYRLALAIFVSGHVFDFLFSSIWMHGYVWSLNQRVDLDLSEKSAGAIVEHQRERVGLGERVVHAAVAVLLVYALLWIAGFRGRNQRIWRLMHLSLATGALCGVVRCVQMRQRLYPALHEAFYVYLLVFCVGLVLTLHISERHPKPSPITVVDAVNEKKTE